MKIEDQVCSLEQAKKLKELGISAEAKLIYVHNGLESEGFKVESRKDYYSGYAGEAYSVAELGSVLPFLIGCKSGLDDDYFLSIIGGSKGWIVFYATNKKDISINSEGELDRPRGYLHNTSRRDYSLAKAIANYVIMLLESKTLNPEEINERLK